MTANSPEWAQAPTAPQNLSQKRPPPPPASVRRYLSLPDFEAAAARYLPRSIGGFVSGAVENNASLRDNREAFAEWGFVPRVLRDTRGRNLKTTLFGQEYDAPFGLPPMGASALVAYRGDLALTQAARARNVPMIMSASSLIPLEDVAKANPDAWYQAYLPGEAERIEPLVDRVAAAGFKTFVLTVDVQVSSNRENNVRNGYSIPLKPTPQLLWDGITHPGWVLNTFFKTMLTNGMPHFENMDAGRGPPIVSSTLMRAFGARDGLAWEHLELIRRRWKGKLVVKGIVSPEDARMCRDAGADGIMVSNHGGRQLDGTISGLRSLAEIARDAGGMTVMYDGGIRRGSDVLKALALGASFVFVGRPMLSAAAVAGEEGVKHAIGLLSEEIDRNMAMMGIQNPSEMSMEYMRPMR